MKSSIPANRARLKSACAAAALFASISPLTLAAQTPPDPAHAAHVAAGLMPAATSAGDPALAKQITELQAKVARLETTFAKYPAPMAAAPVDAAMAPMAGMPAVPGAAPAAPMAGMSAPAAPAGAAMPMMGMMEKMMGMMDKMMPMPGPSMPAAAPMAPMPPAGMAMMPMDKMEMAGMMGMAPMAGGASGSSMPQSALPGFPGASHLYHLGATGFFLDHPQHIALATEQTAALNKAKESALLAKSTADRAIEQAEQELWTLTASDQPDAAKIETKIRQAEKLTGDSRLAFIRAVGDASKILTEDQRKILTGFAPPAPAMSTATMAAPAAAMAPMKNM